MHHYMIASLLEYMINALLRGGEGCPRSQRSVYTTSIRGVFKTVNDRRVSGYTLSRLISIWDSRDETYGDTGEYPQHGYKQYRC